MKCLVSSCVFFLIFGPGLAANDAKEKERSGMQAATAGSREVKMGLTLNDCVRKAFENNVTLRKSFETLDSVSTFNEESKGRFDPVYFTDAMGMEVISPTTSVLDAGAGVDSYDQDNFSLSTGFTGSLYSGATYRLALSWNRTYNPDSQFLLYNPIIRSDASVEITQPLLRGGWTTYNRSEIITANLNTEAEAFAVETSINEIVFNTVDAYWKLIFAIEDLKVKEKSLELAEDLLRINTRKKEEGVFSKMEVLEASADVAVREEQLLTAKNAVLAAEDQLKHLIFPFASPKEWEIRIQPLTEAEEATEIIYDPEELIAEASKYRPDYRQLTVDLKKRELDLIRARNELMPNLDLRGKWGYRANGSNYGNALNDIEEMDYRYFEVGLQFSFPLGNRSAESVYRRAEIDYRRALTSLDELRIQIEHELRNAVREVELQRQRIKATRESFRLARERYLGEVKRLEAGLSISYQVREAERNLTDEAVKKILALLDYQIALAAVARAKGTLLSEYRIHVPSENLENWLSME